VRDKHSTTNAQVTETDCISLLYMVWGFGGKNRPRAANAKSRKILEPQGEAKRAPPGKTPFLNYKTVALPLSYAGTPGRLTESANDSSYPFTSLRITKIHSAPEDHHRFTGSRKHSREPTRLPPAKVSDYWIAVLLLSQIFLVNYR